MYLAILYFEQEIRLLVGALFFLIFTFGFWFLYRALSLRMDIKITNYNYKVHIKRIKEEQEREVRPPLELKKTNKKETECQQDNQPQSEE